MITRLKIEGLFGNPKFNYDLVFKNPVTILTGPNGFGKSTVLRILEALAKGNFTFFLDLNFNSIHVETGVCDSLDLVHDGDSLRVDGIQISQDMIRCLNSRNLQDFIDATPEFDQLDFVMLPENLRDEISNAYKEMRCSATGWANLICRDFNKTKFISEQRLLYLEGDKNEEIEVVLKTPQRLKTEIDKADNAFSKKSSELDSVMLKRINESEETTEEHYTDCEQQLNTRLDKLRNYNLKDEQTQSEPYQKKNSAALIAVLNINLERYSAYDSLLAKLDLFVGIVNNRLMFKKLEISREKGFEIIDEKTKEPLALEQLSSGEKQVIVLYYDLIFNNNENLLLLIDEPEISMHISWQSKFMEDLIRIAEHGNFRAIVATHSPDIINGLWDLQIDLGEQYQGNLYGEDEGESHGD